MIKQKRNQKVTEKNKQRVNLFQLQERVEQLEKALDLQNRINANQVKFNDMRLINEEATFENVKLLANDVMNLKAESAVKKQHVLKRAINRFWAFLGK